MNSSSNPKSPDPDQPQALKPEWRYSDYRATLYLNEKRFAILSEDGTNALSGGKVETLLEALNTGSEHASRASLQEKWRHGTSDSGRYIQTETGSILYSLSEAVDAHNATLSLPKPSEERDAGA